MARGAFVLVAAVGLAGLGSAVVDVAVASEPASPQACPAAPVEVAAVDDQDRRDACAGAQASLAFLAKHGVQPTEPVVLEITRQLPPEAGPTAVGCFLEDRNRVFMLPYAEFRRQKTWFGVPIDRELYRALAAHETAHAVAACHFKVPRPTIQAKEYVAYVAMFASMAPELRRRALAAVPGEGFASAERATELLYMFDPMRFGAEAYRHYMKAGNGPAFLRAVLDGRELSE
jgi:hypothetical protein